MSHTNGMGAVVPFANGQYIICVDNVIYRSNGENTGKIEDGISIGKIYKDITSKDIPIESRFVFYTIINDNGTTEIYYQKYFKVLTLDEVREFKLNNILND